VVDDWKQAGGLVLLLLGWRQVAEFLLETGKGARLQKLP